MGLIFVRCVQFGAAPKYKSGSSEIKSSVMRGLLGLGGGKRSTECTSRYKVVLLILREF